MKTPTKHACPRCDYPLVPVHAVEGSRRRVIALACPEPYCDHMERSPSPSETAGSAPAEPADLRAAN